MNTYASSHLGLIRKENEDSYRVSDELHLMAVADGIGGHAHGKIASEMTIEHFFEYFAELSSLEPEERFEEAIAKVNRDIFRYRQEELNDQIIGTTLTACYVDGQKLYFAHIGDSRLLLCKAGMLPLQLTDDHTYLAELARHDEDTFVKLQANQLSEKKNYLLKAIGPEESIIPQIETHLLEEGDILLLMTDGLYKYLSLQEIKQYVDESSDLSVAGKALEKLALSRGGDDNITLILYKHEGRV